MAWSPKTKRPVKKVITEVLFEYIKNTNPGKVFKTYLCLPSTKGTDVKEALRQGVIDKNTKIIAIEKKYEHLCKLKANLTRLGFKANSRVVIHKELCEIEECDLDWACDELGVSGIDLFYIDSCSCLIDCLQQWIKNVVGHIRTDDAVIATNVLGARAVWDLQKYVDQGDLLSNWRRKNKNKWVSPIANCLSELTLKITGFSVGYKDTQPMVLCVNGYSDSCSTSHIVDCILKTHSLRNLGYV